MAIKRRVNFRPAHKSTRKAHVHDKVNWMSWQGAKSNNPEMAVLGVFLDRRDRATSVYERRSPDLSEKSERALLESLRRSAHIVSLLKHSVAKKEGWTPRDVDVRVRPIATFSMSDLDVLDMEETFKGINTDEAKMAFEMYKMDH